MTAQRWWVKLFARWQARLDAVQGQIQMASLAVTAFSTFSLLLRDAGYGDLVVPLGGLLAIAGPGYAYFFFEGGVWNQVSRDRADMSGNFAGPGARISAELIAAGLAPVLNDGAINKDEREQMEQELDRVFEKYRDGVDIDDYEG